MKLNRRLLSTFCISVVLLIFTLTSCTNKPVEDTNTAIGDTLEDKNNSNENKQDNNTEENDGNENVDTDDNEINDDKNTEDANDKNNEDSNSKDNNLGNDENTHEDTTAADNVENKTETSIDNMEINKDGIYAISNNYFKSIYPLDEKSVAKAANYIKNLKETYLTENNKVFYAVVPDKSYYDKSSSYDKLDYDKMVDMLNENIDNVEYIKIKDLLSLDDYYKTDIHWRQEKIVDIANRIGEKFDFKIDINNFKNESFSGFKGMYTKYVTNTNFKEDVQYLTNDHISNATVDNYQNKKFTSVYDTDRLTTDIPYDVFLSGASPFITITNTSTSNDKELVIFRDSFTSSLAPLLVSEYSKITLIDTRYMMSNLLKDFIEFNNQDILFLYSSALINKSSILK
jgi:hypothetical protein